MSKPTLSSYIQNDLELIDKKKEPGPYLTISRQYGCDGYELGDLLLKRLNERDGEEKWRLFKKEILKQLAEDTGLTEEVIEKERHAKISFLKDLMRGVRKSNIPDGYEIRKKITMMVRTAAFEGYAIIIGQGGAAATGDLANGLSVRIEAPKEWRITRVCWREKLQRAGAITRIEKVEKDRKHVRKIYEEVNKREPPFNLVLDNSMFSIDELADMIIFAMEQKKLIGKDE